MYSCGPPLMDVQVWDDQHELTYSSYVRTRVVILKTCRRRWVIGRNGERRSGISAQTARHDDDDDILEIKIKCHKVTFDKMFPLYIMTFFTCSDPLGPPLPTSSTKVKKVNHDKSRHSREELPVTIFKGFWKEMVNYEKEDNTQPKLCGRTNLRPLQLGYDLWKDRYFYRRLNNILLDIFLFMRQVQKEITSAVQIFVTTCLICPS